jgi:TrmH family RNA methyltransferase
LSAETITSRKNPLLQKARAVRDGRDKELVFVEGVRLCEEAARAGLKIETVLCVENLRDEERGGRLLELLEKTGGRIVFVHESILESVADTTTPQGVIALARRPRTGREAIEGEGVAPLVVIMHRAGNPSNAGAMLRVAEAAGATAAIATEGSVDLFSPKALRGAMGSAFRLPVWTGATLDEALRWCRGRGIRIVSAEVRATSLHTGIDWKRPRAILVGPEAGGLTADEARAADDHVRIPMREPVESLNVAVALGVILYEAARQRGGF